jgi:uncharacterized membrane protein YfcA
MRTPRKCDRRDPTPQREAFVAGDSYLIADLAISLPALLAGSWLGLKLFGRLDEASFRKIVLVLLLASGAVLMI